MDQSGAEFMKIPSKHSPAAARLLVCLMFHPLGNNHKTRLWQSFGKVTFNARLRAHLSIASCGAYSSNADLAHSSGGIKMDFALQYKSNIDAIATLLLCLIEVNNQM